MKFALLMIMALTLFDLQTAQSKRMKYLRSDKDPNIDHLLGHLSPDGKKFITCRGDEIELSNVTPYKAEDTDAVCPTPKFKPPAKKHK